MKKGILYLVSTPIGNYEDITIRALKILQAVDFILCEEYKEAKRLLSKFGIVKEFIALNEHTEKKIADELLLKLAGGSTLALISDCGTPLFSDPGHLLVRLCISHNIPVIPIPGANSLLPALIISGFDTEKFYYYGWLSPKRDERRKQLFEIKKLREIVVILDTPYRLKSLLTDIVKILGKNVPAVIAFEITKTGEQFFRGTTDSLLKLTGEKNLKGEFVLILNLKSGNK